ncbi:Hypothetical protein Tpal_2665 [Trichococcus palustris]|jgi:uncharacterized membrane protein YkvA (DUF1232 family)|uniref:DUF1232 domain-containing protein n=1 Tax=Trichococcus palustris TaxID=140314 RepID=A0A143Z2F8_9LACT|nr:Hypothetical protein Tpal_2665 [Trichococcus palustris]SFL20132.1 Protein of unknown function [Trichococcus palustris]
MKKKLEQLAKALKLQVGAVFLAYRSDEVAWYKKAFLLLILLYALSPIDLIPDFIPVIGYLDDAILLPLMIYVGIKMIPDHVWAESKAKAAEGIIIEKKYKLIGGAFIASLWAVSFFYVAQKFIL